MLKGTCSIASSIAELSPCLRSPVEIDRWLAVGVMGPKGGSETDLRSGVSDTEGVGDRVGERSIVGVSTLLNSDEEDIFRISIYRFLNRNMRSSSDILALIVQVMAQAGIREQRKHYG